MRRTYYRFGTPSAGLPRSTIAIIAVSAAIYVLSWIGLADRIVPWLAFTGDLGQPWTLLTYPLASVGEGRGLIWFLFSLYWLYVIGSYLEPELGQIGFVAAFFGLALVGSLAMFFGELITPGTVLLMGLGLPLAAVTCLWGARYAQTEVRLWGIIPIKGMWIAILTALITLFGYGASAPILGILALAPLALAALWGLGRLPIPYGRVDPATLHERKRQQAEKQEFNEFITDVRQREIDRKERERLKRLFDSSDEPDPDK